MNLKHLSLMALILILLLIKTNIYCQVEINSVLTSEAYIKNPRLYLSKLDTTKILIDRVHFDELLLNINGIDRVTSIDCSDWAKIYKTLKYASLDTTTFYSWSSIQRKIDFYESQKIYCISILDYFFEKIKQSAIDNSEFITNVDFLIDNNSTNASYDKHRIFAASCSEHNITSDRIGFIVTDNLFFTNNTSQKFKDIEIDFGNGNGFQKINLNEIQYIDYSPNSEYVEIKVKIIFERHTNKEIETCYSHFSFYRTGTSTVPALSNQSSSISKSNPIEPDGGLLYYPVGEMHQSVAGTWWTGRELEYCIIFSPNNTTGKLVRPFIIVDGFDPGNRRNYYHYRYDTESDLLPKERDFRGLYQLLNGDPSPWYSDSPDINLIQSLRNDGYDIIFVNFLNGAGDIPTNANSLRGFLNNVINNSTYRDNNTEEAILIGPSMGGLITRYALTSMEQSNPKESHYVKLWISFDSPQKGAYIPIGLQHSIFFLSKINDWGGLLGILDAITNAKNGFIAGINSLNSLAAKQMLTAHYSQTSSQQYNSPEFDNLFNSLNQLGFPKYSKNYAISNGGTTKLYDEDGAEILDFKIFPWTYAKAWGNKNSDGNNKIYEGSRQGFGNDESKSTNNQIGYENAPGGWNAALYTLNCNPGNWNQKGETNKQYTKATFMVTSSAFGIPVTRGNIYNTHNSYTGILEQESKPGKTLTPFDYVYGMNDNEEHVRISYSTGSYLINEVLKRESDNILRPIVRNEQAVNQEINGKVAYVAKQNVKLGGDGNNFTIRNGSNVNVRAGKSVNLSLGFKVEAGATFSASIADENYGTTLKTTGLFTKSADYSRPSLYLRRVYDYSDKGCPKYAGSILTLSAFPNPTNGKLFISLKGIVNEPINIQLFDYIGKNVHFTILSNDDNYVIDISQLQNGMYLLIASNSSFVKSIKIIKQ
ncbi:MAG: T9SS type A sorting domain-containing protein [Bacteroidales bacterium]|nr:T9SS type A sorting domain-containing protein [Bacteroidales bacterium]